MRDRPHPVVSCDGSLVYVCLSHPPLLSAGAVLLERSTTSTMRQVTWITIQSTLHLHPLALCFTPTHSLTHSHSNTSISSSPCLFSSPLAAMPLMRVYIVQKKKSTFGSKSNNIAYAEIELDDLGETIAAQGTSLNSSLPYIHRHINPHPLISITLPICLHSLTQTFRTAGAVEGYYQLIPESGNGTW